MKLDSACLNVDFLSMLDGTAEGLSTAAPPVDMAGIYCAIRFAMSDSLASRKQAKAGTTVYSRSLDLENGMVCISLNDDTSAPRWRLTAETNDMWYSRPLTVCIMDLYGRVSHGDRQQIMDPIEEKVFTEIIPQKFQEQYNQYTYTSLEINRSITIGYVAKMDDEAMRKLSYNLNKVLEQWKSMEPAEKPYFIPNYRKFEKKVRKEEKPRSCRSSLQRGRN